MMAYDLPKVLESHCTTKDYNDWLRRRADAHVKRDRKRGNKVATRPLYKDAIHKAVCDGGDRDAYTGRQLRWDLIRIYNNEKSKQGKRKYKKGFADLPTVDHEDEGQRHPQFKICGWRTNDCKNDLTVKELKAFCEEFLRHQAQDAEPGVAADGAIRHGLCGAQATPARPAAKR
jgi:hypothetical protein